jgi:GR25 family glycosyltransferase involved in LPS biosynthesis
MISKILVINTPARTDRLKHMTEELGGLGQTFQRFEAIAVDASCQFQNKAIRSNWMSHEECLKIAAENVGGLTLILEDDVKFHCNWAAVEEYVKKMEGMGVEWDALYLYGNPTSDVNAGIIRIGTVHCTHAYVVNPISALKIREMLIAERARIEQGLDKDLKVIDWFFTRVVQNKLKFYGTPQLTIQLRQSLGSDLGWGLYGSPKVYD